MTVHKHSSEFMHEIYDESVHLVITSPPYPMIQKWDDLYGTTNFNRQHEKLDRVWEECSRILVPGGIICINIGDATRTINKKFCCYPNCARATMALCGLKLTPLIPILWKKISNRPNAFLGSGMLPPNGYVSQDCENILIFRKGNLRKFKPKDPKRYESSYTKEERDKWFQQIWEIKGARGAGKTSEFPEEIPRRLIRMYSILGDTVVDPFSGTGTTGKVAKLLGREFVGYQSEKGFEK